MSQREFLRSLDATIAASMLDIGLADRACWQSSRGGRKADGITVMVDRGVEMMGTDGGVTVNNTVITLFRADTGGREAENDIITIDDDRWRVRQVLDRDESQARCAVVPA